MISPEIMDVVEAFCQIFLRTLEHVIDAQLWNVRCRVHQEFVQDVDKSMASSWEGAPRRIVLRRK